MCISVVYTHTASVPPRPLASGGVSGSRSTFVEVEVEAEADDANQTEEHEPHTDDQRQAQAVMQGDMQSA